MSVLSIKAIIWRVCGRQDIRALLGRGGGHQVIPSVHSLWKKHFNTKIRKERQGGTSVQFESERWEDGAEAFEAEIYLHESRNEPRVKVGQLITSGCHAFKLAEEKSSSIDPDDSPTDKLVIIFVKTTDDKFHIRGSLRSELPDPLKEWVAESVNGGRTFEGIALDSLEARVWRSLQRNKNVLLYGPPGTGKTRLMLRLQRAFVHGISTLGFDSSNPVSPFTATEDFSNLPPNRKSEFVTFHQSLSYESFVVGVRPVMKPGGKMEFISQDGIFLKLAQHVLKDNDSASLLLIDEINRGNVSDILGELITIIESDKRLDENGEERETTVKVMLPTKPEKIPQEFRMPHHFYVIASMNSLDRSVAPLDSALRRRFRIIHLQPDGKVLRKVLLAGAEPINSLIDPDSPTPIEVKSLAIRVLEKINEHVLDHWGPEFQLGHSYVLEVKDSKGLIDAFAETIFPQVFELYRDRPQNLLEMFEECGLVRSRDGISEVGFQISHGPGLLLPDLHEMITAETIKKLYHFAHGNIWSSPSPSI